MTFWLEERDLPEGCGFELYDSAHLTMIVIVALFLAVSVLLYRGMNEKQRRTGLRIIAVSLPVLEAWKIAMLIISGRMGVGHLPLHLCSMAIYLYPLAALTVNVRIRETLTEIGLITLLPAALSALLFPDWTMYPVWNFYSLHSFLWHALSVLFPLLCLMNGWCRPSIRHIWWNTVFLTGGALLIGLFDTRTSCNYWFLCRPVPDTPLQWLYDAFGEGGYPVSLLFVATIVNLGVYGIYYLIKTCEENLGKNT